MPTEHALPDRAAAQVDGRRWRRAQRDYIDEPLEAVPREQVQCSSAGRPWHGISLWHQRADAQDLYIPPAGKHCIIVRRGPDTGLLQRHGNETHDVRWKTGEVVLLPAHTPSFWRTELPRDNLHLDLSPHWLEKVSGQEAASLGLRSCFGKADPVLTQLVQVLLLALDDHSGLQPAFADGIAASVAIHLLEHYRLPGQAAKSAPGLTARQLRHLQAYVLDHLDQPLSVEQLAAEVQLSAWHFARCFKASCGLTPHRFVLQQRLQRARTLLLESRLPVGEIARQLGFASAPHFSQAFARHWGLSPLRLRQQH